MTAADEADHLVEILEVLASPASRYEGRPADGPAAVPPGERRDRIELRAGLGVVGDRYFGRPAHRRASVTLQAVEGLEAAARELGLGATPGLAQTRRTLLLRGVDLTALLGAEIALDAGLGPVRLRIHRPAPPCAWMDQAIAPGAHRALRGHGGVRGEPLSDGALRPGPATLRVLAL